MQFPWLRQIRALGWDVDGTLYPSGTIPRALVREKQVALIAAKNGWGLTHARRELEALYTKFGSTTKALTALGVDGEEFFVKLWDELPLETYLSRDERLVHLFHDLVLHVPRQFIITNSNTVEQTERKIRLLGLSPRLFEFVVSTVGMGVTKPDSQPFRVALEKLNLWPDTVLYVGDRVETDVVGAKRVGMRTCLVWSPPSHQATEGLKADISVKTVYDVATLFI